MQPSYSMLFAFDRLNGSIHLWKNESIWFELQIKFFNSFKASIWRDSEKFSSVTDIMLCNEFNE